MNLRMKGPRICLAEEPAKPEIVRHDIGEGPKSYAEIDGDWYEVTFPTGGTEYQKKGMPITDAKTISSLESAYHNKKTEGEAKAQAPAESSGGGGIEQALGEIVKETIRVYRDQDTGVYKEKP